MSSLKIKRAPRNWWIDRPVVVAVSASILLGLGSAGANAETLRQALAAAYKFNPQIEAERANLRATDEEVPRAYSSIRPTVTATGDIGAQYSKSTPGSNGTTNPRGVGLQIQQNVFRGFRTLNEVRRAEANIRAGRAALHSVEQSVLLAAVTAYMNVVRDQAIVRLRENNVRVLTRNLRATEDRFKAGEVTKTDVAQSQARRSGAVSALDLARANLKSSRANYERVIGNAPSQLHQGAVPEGKLPKSLPDAKRTALNEAPAVISALYLEEAARHNVEQVWGELLPSVRLDANFSKRFDPSLLTNESETASVVGTLTIPLYLSGEVRARLRQAKHLHVRTIQQIAQARTEAREATVAAWAALQASRAQVRSDQSQVSANEVALSGVSEEEKVGQRTVLDVLDAEQELLDAQVRLVSTQRDLVVNAYSLVAAVGRLTAQELGLSNVVYDPEAHYFEVRRKWFGIDITHRDGRREHLNVWATHGDAKTLK